MQKKTCKKKLNPCRTCIEPFAEPRETLAGSGQELSSVSMNLEMSTCKTSVFLFKLLKI